MRRIAALILGTGALLMLTTTTTTAAAAPAQLDGLTGALGGLTGGLPIVGSLL
jgi:hypothetical protein